MKSARTFNESNERIKHEYLAFLENNSRRNVTYVDSVALVLYRYEVCTGFADFDPVAFECDHRDFRAWLLRMPANGGGTLKTRTVSGMMKKAQDFFHWLWKEQRRRVVAAA